MYAENKEPAGGPAGLWIADLGTPPLRVAYGVATVVPVITMGRINDPAVAETKATPPPAPQAPAKEEEKLDLKKLEYRGYDSAGIAIWRNGKIEVASEVGKGTTFTITLPLKSAESSTI